MELPHLGYQCERTPENLSFGASHASDTSGEWRMARRLENNFCMTPHVLIHACIDVEHAQHMSVCLLSLGIVLSSTGMTCCENTTISKRAPLGGGGKILWTRRLCDVMLMSAGAVQGMVCAWVDARI